MTNQILSIKIYPQKGCEGEALTQATLAPNQGIPGDRHNNISLQTKNARHFMEENPGGICFAKFKANILFDGQLQNSELLELGEAALEITGGKTFCFDSCKYHSVDKPCPMHQGVAFGRVVRGGLIIACSH
ncbi:MAG: hypothetical protein FWE21_08260 [Defluviitaleaceae bacterium]|nr:hypothetical protein [Defluviitaleaceae bacterium]